MKSRVDEALTELVDAVKEGFLEPASTLDRIAERLEALGDTMGPVDFKVAQEARGTAASLRQHSSDLRKRAEAYAVKMLPNDERPTLLVVEKSA